MQSITNTRCSQSPRFGQRNQTGQALAEGTAFLVLLMGIFVGCLLLFVNVSIVISQQQKVQVAATQAAQYIIGQRYWLGAVRTDYDAAKTAATARTVADSVLQALNLPASSSFSATDVSSTNGVTVTTVTVAVSGLHLLNGGTLPFPLAASSASTTAQEITQGWRAVSIQCADPNNPQDQAQWRTAMVPCYNYLVGSASSQESPVPFSRLNGPSMVGAVTVVRADSAPAAISSGPGGGATKW
jgi:hypothetical protein